MPALNAQIMTTTAKARFDRASAAAPRKISPTPHFGPASTATPNRALRSFAPPLPGAPVGGPPAPDFGALVEPTCRAICGAHDLWRVQAFFRGIIINGPVASGGTLEGPTLDPLVRTQLVALVGQSATLGPLVAVAGALSEAWELFQRSVSVPGLPWYPSFVAIPSSQAPPTPNVPMPLAALTYSPGTFTSASTLAGMKRRLSTATADATRFFEAIAEGFQLAVSTWIPSQPVSNVLGKGPVPTFAPPYVPTGPVVMGDNIAAPGHLQA